MTMDILSQLPTPVSNTLKEVWRRRGDITPGWHGYGLNLKGKDLTVRLFVENQQARISLERELPLVPLLPQTEIVETRRFRALDTAAPAGVVVGAGHAIGAGAMIVSASATCPRREGAIGTFLREANAPAGAPKWILSAHHVLCGGPACRSGLQISTLSGQVLSNHVVCKELVRFDNVMDAAVARLSDASLGVRHPLITDPAPVIPESGAFVDKIGGASGSRNGSVVARQASVDVEALEIPGGIAEMENQLVVASTTHTPFAASRDSGSLVVHNGRPAGLLFAKSEFPVNNPLGLVTPIEPILAELSRLAGVQLAVL